MKVAVVYNRESTKVINLFGVPSREKYGLKSIKKIADALRKGRHQVITLEGDKDLVDKLEEFMPRVVKGERPGMVFNLSYGIQGRARYTHVPGILEMLGIPYVGSGPLAHSLSLDKVVAKVLFKQNGLPTPDFAVLQSPGFEMPDLEFPLIVKPKNESVSMGIRVVNNEDALREAADSIFEHFRQPVLVEQYIEGREINVGLLGNNPPEVFPPAEILFDEKGPRIYTLEDKKRTSGRTVRVRCPADLSPGQTAKAQETALRAFEALECFDCARIDMRMDGNGNFHLLEINSLPSLGEHGSYVEAARHMGMDFTALVNRLVDVAGARYFGTTEPSALTSKRKDSETDMYTYLVERRNHLEKRVQVWSTLSSRTEDPIGIRMAVAKLQSAMNALGMKETGEICNAPHVHAWETKSGMKDGTLLILHVDVPLNPVISAEPFRINPEWIYGEGVGVSRAPLISIIHALQALRHVRVLGKIPLGVLAYTDEGIDCRFSSDTIRHAASLSKRVLVLRPGNIGDGIVTQRRGQRKYKVVIEGRPARLGQVKKSPEVLRWVLDCLNRITDLSSRKERIALSPVDIKTEAFPLLLPHRITVIITMSYIDQKIADDAEANMRALMKRKGFSVVFTLASDRPPMKEKRTNAPLGRILMDLSKKWDIPLETESSLWPSVAGLVPYSVPVVCGVGPVAKDLYTSKEAVDRTSLLQRTILLSQFLYRTINE